MARTLKIAPSVLAADFSKLDQEISRVERGGCDLLHIDVMDGHFVPNITFGPVIVKAIRKTTGLPLDVHLMIEKPWQYIEAFVQAGANHITVHAEACEGRLNEVLDQIQSLGCTRGVSVRPKTSLEPIEKHLENIDMVLVMTVNPGFGGQDFMPEMMPKVEALRKMYDRDIEVDGGINTETAVLAVEAGANVLVAGSAIFKQPDVGDVIQKLKSLKAVEKKGL